MRNASAVVLTFLINGDAEKHSTQLQAAKAWELEFINTIHAWKYEHPNITVDFITEVNIEFFPL